MADKVVVPVPDVNEKTGSPQHQPEPSFSDKATNYGDGFAKGFIHVAEGYLAMAEHPLETAAALNPVTAAQQNAMALAGAALGDTESQDHLARQIDPFVKAANKIAEAVDGDYTAKGQVAGFALAGMLGPVPSGVGVAATAEKEMIVAETGAVTALHQTSSAKPMFVPGSNLFDTAGEIYSHITGTAATRSDADIVAKQIDAASVRAQLDGKKGTIQQAVDANDSTVMYNGQTVAEMNAAGEYNRDQIHKRATALKAIAQQNPDIAQALTGVTPTEMQYVLKSDALDAYAGVQPYGSLSHRDQYGIGYTPAQDKALAQKLNLPWNDKVGLFESEIGVNAEFYQAKKALMNLGEFKQQVASEQALHMLNPSAPKGAALTQAEQLLEHLQENGGVLTQQARQLLPKELQALPQAALGQVQSDITPLIGPQHPSGLLNASSAQTTNLMAVQSQNQVAAGQSETAAAMKAQLLQEIITAQEDSRAIVVAPPKSAGEIEAQQRYDENLNGQGPVKKALITLSQGIRDPIGYLGVSTEHFHLNAEKSIAKSEYAGLKEVGLGTNLRITSSIAAVGGTAALVGLPAAGAAWAGLVALRFAENYGWTESMKNAVMPTVEKLGQSYAHFQNQAGEAAINKFLEVANTLPKDARGNLTPESQQVLQRVDANTAEFQASVVPDMHR